MPQIFDVTANENARYKRNELECNLDLFREFYFERSINNMCLSQLLYNKSYF